MDRYFRTDPNSELVPTEYLNRYPHNINVRIFDPDEENYGKCYSTFQNAYSVPSREYGELVARGEVDDPRFQDWPSRGQKFEYVGQYHPSEYPITKNYPEKRATINPDSILFCRNKDCTDATILQKGFFSKQVLCKKGNARGKSRRRKRTRRFRKKIK